MFCVLPDNRFRNSLSNIPWDNKSLTSLVSEKFFRNNSGSIVPGDRCGQLKNRNVRSLSYAFVEHVLGTPADPISFNGLSTVSEKAMSQNIVMHFSKIAYNTEIPKTRFDLPPDLKAKRDSKK